MNYAAHNPLPWEAEGTSVLAADGNMVAGVVKGTRCYDDCHEIAVLLSNTPKMYGALKQIAQLWPEPPNCADINPDWLGENDGKQRAILLESAINIARAAIVKAERSQL